jgi:hypothetical protein
MCVTLLNTSAYLSPLECMPKNTRTIHACTLEKSHAHTHTYIHKNHMAALHATRFPWNVRKRDLYAEEICIGRQIRTWMKVWHRDERASACIDTTWQHRYEHAPTSNGMWTLLQNMFEAPRFSSSTFLSLGCSAHNACTVQRKKSQAYCVSNVKGSEGRRTRHIKIQFMSQGMAVVANVHGEG